MDGGWEKGNEPKKRERERRYTDVSNATVESWKKIKGGLKHMWMCVFSNERICTYNQA